MWRHVSGTIYYRELFNRSFNFYVIFNNTLMSLSRNSCYFVNCFSFYLSTHMICTFNTFYDTYFLCSLWLFHVSNFKKLKIYTYIRPRESTYLFVIYSFKKHIIISCTIFAFIIIFCFSFSIEFHNLCIDKVWIKFKFKFETMFIIFFFL